MPFGIHFYLIDLLFSMIEDKNQGKTGIENLGEFGLIHHLTQNFDLNHKSSIKGIGDDAAILDSQGEQIVVSTDMLVEGVHFDLAYTPLPHLGYKAVVVNLSDIAAMNAIPTQITVSLAVSNRFPVEALEALYSGIEQACKNYQVDLIGGDTTSSNKGLILSITAIGFAKKEAIVCRDGASENDLLVVSGDLGAAYMGLQILEREKAVFKVNPNNQPDLSSYDYVVGRQLKPEARVDMVTILKNLGVQPTAMIDISDGLSSEILHLAKNSNLGCNLFEEKIPLDPTVISSCEEFQIDSSLVALSGGEDYELLFTIAQKDFDAIKGNPHMTVIGHMAEASAGCHLITRGDTRIPITAQGWNSFQVD